MPLDRHGDDVSQSVLGQTQDEYKRYDQWHKVRQNDDGDCGQDCAEQQTHESENSPHVVLQRLLIQLLR